MQKSPKFRYFVFSLLYYAALFKSSDGSIPILDYTDSWQKNWNREVPAEC